MCVHVIVLRFVCMYVCLLLDLIAAGESAVLPVPRPVCCHSVMDSWDIVWSVRPSICGACVRVS